MHYNRNLVVYGDSGLTPRNIPPTLNLESVQRLQSLFCQRLLWYMHDAHKSVFIRAFV